MPDLKHLNEPHRQEGPHRRAKRPRRRIDANGNPKCRPRTFGFIHITQSTL